MSLCLKIDQEGAMEEVKKTKDILRNLKKRANLTMDLQSIFGSVLNHAVLKHFNLIIIKSYMLCD